MKINELSEYIGLDSKSILKSSPFNKWKFRKTVDYDLPELRVNYESSKNKFSFTCDSDEKIDTIFIERDEFDNRNFEIPFSSNRNDVLGYLGAPTKSGPARVDPILGAYGPWDRFDKVGFSIHILYHARVDRIRRVTLSRIDAASR